MTVAEEGVLLLCSTLGQKDCHPLTMPQFRELGLRVRSAHIRDDPLRELNPRDLEQLGYGEEDAKRIVSLLGRQDRMEAYLRTGLEHGCLPVTRLSADYPRRFRDTLGFSCPPVLFCRGDKTLLHRSGIAVVGSREPAAANAAFAAEVGRWAAEQGLVLISGGAAGIDRMAQEACLEAGGSCVIFTADSLLRVKAQERCLFVSTDGYDIPFASYRALYRNHLIHIQGQQVVAAQCTCGKGGTWQGCTENLKRGWSPVYVFADDSQGARALTERGAVPVSCPEDLEKQGPSQISLFE